MPVIDLTMPSGSLTDHAKAELMATLTRTLLKWEGAKSGNEAAESIAWTFLHEPALVTVAGRPAQGDHQRDRRRQLGRDGRVFRLPDILAFAGAGEREIERRMARLRRPAGYPM